MNWLIEFLIRQKVRKIVDRRTIYTFTIGPKEELPLEVWVYLVKRNAGFACEECDEKNNLDSHHLRRRARGGKNVLRNGKCLCKQCHSFYRTYRAHEDERQRKFTDAFGYDKGNEIYKQYEECATGKQFSQFLEKLAEEYPREMGRYYGFIR